MMRPRLSASFVAAASVVIWAGALFAGDAEPTREQIVAEYAKLMEEVKAVAPKKGAPKADIDKFLGVMKDRLGKFAEKYPGSKESFEASLGLGATLSQIEDGDARKWLEFAAKNAPKDADPRALLSAHVLLAKALASAGEAEAAKASVEAVRKISAEAAAELTRDVEATLRLRVGGTPYDIEEKDIDGKQFSLSKLKGKVVVIDFWATWCPPCRAEMPNVKKAYDDFHAKGLDIVGISLDKEEEKLRAYVKENQIPWTQVSDFKGWEGKVPAQFCVRSIPLMFVLDRKGVIRYRNVRGEALREAVAKLVAEE